MGDIERLEMTAFLSLGRPWPKIVVLGSDRLKGPVWAIRGGYGSVQLSDKEDPCRSCLESIEEQRVAV